MNAALPARWLAALVVVLAVAAVELIAPAETGAAHQARPTLPATAETPPPPAGDWLDSPEVPGFRFKVLITNQAGTEIEGRREEACIPETLCVSGALDGRSEVFLRVVGPKPNGYLWPTLVKFSTSLVEVWVEQVASGELAYYPLAGASPGNDVLPGLFDRTAFSPLAARRRSAAGAEVIAYDDGEMDWGANGVSAESLVRFVAPFDTAGSKRLEAVQLCLARDSSWGGVDRFDFSAIVYGANGNRPGARLGSVATSATGLPSTPDQGVTGDCENLEIDVSALDITVGERFFAGIEYDPSDYPIANDLSGYMLGVDRDVPLRPMWVWAFGGWYGMHTFPEWTDEVGARALMVRAVVDEVPVEPSIDVGGPATGEVGETLDFTATASDCEPIADGWAWTTGGGMVDGSADGAVIAVSWASPGAKTLTATNAACGAAQGSAKVQIAEPDEPGEPAITVVGPATGEVGQALTFTATASDCEPVAGGWLWETDGGVVDGDDTDATIVVSWAGAGTKKVVAGNAGCGEATGSRQVVVEEGDGVPDPEPPPGDWLTAPDLPDHRFKVRITSPAGDTPPVAREAVCIEETICVSGALPGRSEVFLRVVGPKPNGYLWPTLVKFTTSQVEVWIEQLSTGQLNYYLLQGASPGSDDLTGLFDRLGFLP